jgi:hypothetical protein
MKPVPSAEESLEGDDDSDALLITREFDEMEFLAAGPLGVGVPFGAPTEFKQMVLAAATTYLSGNSSVDYTLRRYGESLLRRGPSAEDRAMFTALNDAKSEVAAVAAEISNFDRVTVNWGLLAAELCLLRLTISFRCANFLIRHGYAFEAASIARLILEQIAWAFAVHRLDDESIMNIPPSRCITDLKSILPTAGKFYGELSEYAHLHPQHSPQYVEIQGKRAGALSSLKHFRWQLVFPVLHLADWYRVVLEYIAFDYLRHHKAVRRSEAGSLEPIGDRPFTKKILDHAHVAKKLGVNIVDVDG